MNIQKLKRFLYEVIFNVIGMLIIFGTIMAAFA